LLLGALASACGGSDLPAASLVNTVRILAVSADAPYAAPGEVVSLQALAVDGRADRSSPMQVSWLPAVCMNPANDDYFGCYPAFAAQYAAGQDLTSVLLPGSSRTFTMPADAITSAASHPGASDPYGVAFAFLVACAGHVAYVRGGSSTATPFGCFDASGAALGPDQFVFAFARVYAYADRRNGNPVISQVTYGGAPVDPSVGLTLTHCGASAESKCSQMAFDTVVPDTSWEVDPGALAQSGEAHEGIWVDYFVTAGSFANDSEVLFDARSGRVSGTGDGWAAPLSPGNSTAWAVVHDTRGGAAWVSIPLNVN
jgi:hypothetical protein